MQTRSAGELSAIATRRRWWRVDIGRLAAAIMLLPYAVLLAIFFLIPVGMVVVLSFQSWVVGKPLDPALRIDNYTRLISDSYALTSIWNTFKLGFGVTALTLFLGFPVAYKLARSRSRWAGILRLLIVAPLLVSVVIRAYGWIVLLSPSGLVNQALTGTGLLTEPAKFLFNPKGVVIGLVEVALPLMILSLIGVIENVKEDLEEAALSLGANRFRMFFEVVLPLSLPGILAGSMLVFAITVASFVTPLLLGGPVMPLLATLIYQNFMVTLDWSYGAALSTVMLLISLVIFFVSTKLVGASSVMRQGG